VSALWLVATPSLDGAGLVAVRGPSQTRRQEQCGLNTLTGWSSKTLGCTHPKAGSNVGRRWAALRWKPPHPSGSPHLHMRSVLPRPEADGSHLAHANSTVEFFPSSKLPFPPLKRKGWHDSASGLRLCPTVAPTVARLHCTASAGCPTSWLPGPCLLLPSLGKLSAPRKYRWGNRSVVRAY